MELSQPELVTIERSGQDSRASGDAPKFAILAGRANDIMSLHKGIIVAIPAYNEEVAIGSIVLRCLKYAEEVIVLDDGSIDRTAETARAAGAKVISHIRNEGKGAGIRDAFLYANNRNASILVLIDGDGQHDPDHIPQLIKPLVEKTADIVNGSRFLGSTEHNVPKYRRVGQEVLTAVTNAGTRRKITDTQSGFRAFSKNTFGCFTFRQNGMAIESEMLMDAADAGMSILEVPIDVRYDVEGSTYDPVTHGVSVLNSVIRLVSRRRPLLFFCAPGAGMLAIGTICAFMLLSIFNSTHNLDIEYGISTMLLIILGMMLISTGLMLSSVHDLTRRM
jgi:glycosyltransferase involved in cell wall biosynthesis